MQAYIFEDKESNRAIYEMVISEMGFEVNCFDSTAAFKNPATTKRIAEQASIVLSDGRISPIKGVKAAKLLRERGYTGPFFLATAYGADYVEDIETIRTRYEGHIEIIEKPFPLAKLEEKIRQALNL